MVLNPRLTNLTVPLKFCGLVLVACCGLSSGGCQLNPSANGQSNQPDPGAARQDAQQTVAAPTIQGAAANGVGRSTIPQAGRPADSVMDVGASDAGAVANVPMDLRCRADAQLPQRTDYGKDGPYDVGTMDVTFNDNSRPIRATDKHAASAARTLVTTIYYPASGTTPLLGSAPLAQGGPFPMLMYSHGYSSTRDEGSPVAKRAASYGYIVVAPDFPLTNLLASGGPDVTDAANQPADVSFLIDKLLAFSEDPNHLLANGIDEHRIGALGVSLGGLTTLLVSFHPKLHDLRIKVAMPIAALSAFFAERFYHTRELPTLFVHGDLDALVNYQQNARRAFMRAAPNARLITVAKGTHAAFGAPFDAASVAAINGLIGLPDADPSNADGIGCAAVGDTLNLAGPDYVTALGGAEAFIVPNETPVFCRGDEYKKPAIDPAEQEDIAVRSAVAFFEAYLGKTAATRQDGCRYLLHEVPKNSAVTLE
jgi:dienelactone hydrolase